MKKLIDTATNTTICEIVSNHSMTLDEAIECAGGEIINDANDERWSPEENVIIDGVYYCYDTLDLIYSPDKTAGIPNTSIKKAEQILVDNGIEQDEAATVLQALGYALLDKELYPKMETFYFTYGTDKNFPFQGGWTEVHAADRNQAVALFRREHPDKTPGLVNCSSIYTEKQFQDKVLPLYKDGDAFWSVCHECITPEGVTYPIKENRPDMDQMLKEFDATYGRLYDNPELYGKESATARSAFDEKVKSDPWYKCLVQDFVKARQDFISSDREAAAFEIALQTCLQRQQQRKPNLESQMKAAGERAGAQQPTTPAKNDLTK